MFLFTLKLFAAILVLAGQVGRAGRPSVSYVHRPEVRHYDPPALEWVRKQVAQLPESSSPAEVRQYLVDIRRALKERKELAAPFKGQRVVLGDLLQHLIYLAEADTSECTYSLVSHYIKLIEHAFGQLERISGPANGVAHDANLFNFLQHYGRLRFGRCASKLEHQLEMVAMEKLAPGVEGALDELVGSQECKEHGKANEGADDHDKHLAELASRIDFVKGDFNAKKMLKVAKKHRKPSAKSKLHHQHHQHSSPTSILMDFIGLKCHDLLFDLEHLLNVLSINNLLNEPPNTPERLVKLAEYGRMCHQFEDTDTADQVEATIKRKLATAISKVADFACCRLGLQQTVDESE